ncbi:MAG: pyruvate kinase [Calditrichaeota bacterium]|nr:pyruvate kinase [Calditrichota bacterium]
MKNFFDHKAKIICTIGPTSEDEETLKKLIVAGMDIARLNFSHGTHEEHRQKIERIRKIADELQKPVAIMQDLQGPKIRIGKFKNPPIHLKPGDRFTITTREILGDQSIVSTTYKRLPNDVQPGDNILVNDGLIKLRVKSKAHEDVICEVINGGSLYDRRGINLPGVKISEPSLTKKDKNDVLFGVEHEVDYVALSFVRNARSIAELRKFLGDRAVPIVAKLEKPEALQNLDAIIAEADGVMVARGDLGVEISTEKVPSVQKKIIEKCMIMNKPVITATQMLDSMMVHPIPTRAEANDVANAIFDGSDAVMLSGETAFGKYPLESVQMMNAIIKESESHRSYFRLNPDASLRNVEHDFATSICHSAYHSAEEIKAQYIVVLTRSGYTARKMSNFRPTVPVLALTSNEKTYRRMSLYWGVVPILIEHELFITEDLVDLQNVLEKKGWIKAGDRLVIVAGSSREQGGTNLLRLHKVR